MNRGIVALALVLLFGCGKRGAPLPPLPRGPHAPGQVTSRQIGQRALVGFVVPQPKGGKPSQQSVRAELLRVTYRPGLQPQADPDAFRRRGDLVGQVVSDELLPGSRLFVEDLRLADLSDSGTGWTLRYAVRVRDRRGRSSPLVVAEDLELLQPGPAPRDLTVEPTTDGVRLFWQPPAGTGPYTYNVYRSLPDTPWPEAPLNKQPLAATEFLDPGVMTGQSYTYSVRIALAAGPPYREGRPSERREIVAVDLFAPAPPRGLVVVQEGEAVRLFWDPNPERDLAGYRVQRRVDGGVWEQVGPALIETPSFLDAGASIGRRLSYRILSVDRADPPNASAASEPVEIVPVVEPVSP